MFLSICYGLKIIGDNNLKYIIKVEKNKDLFFVIFR